ncbi:hypothetical protein NL676_020570 [Syzygium grande]|nr:hypothetical protein NL676_020570 [Syzygium grande]
MMSWCVEGGNISADVIRRFPPGPVGARRSWARAPPLGAHSLRAAVPLSREKWSPKRSVRMWRILGSCLSLA